MSFDSAAKKISSGRVHPLYLLYGEETYLVDELLSMIKDKALDGGAVDFNSHTFYSGDAEGSHIKDTIETFPMMAKARLVVIKNFHQMKEKDLQALIPLFENPIDTSVVVLVADKVDKRKKVFKAIKSSGEIVECRRVYDNQIEGWIRHIADKYGLNMTGEALSLLHQSVGNSLTDIDNECRKLQQFLGSCSDVSLETVREVVSQARVESVFELANAIGSSDRAAALTRLAYLLDQGQNEVGVLAMVSRHFRILSAIQEGWKQGLRGAKLGQAAGVHPYFVNQYLEQSQNWSADRLRVTFSALLETDKALKSSPLSSHIWLENFVLRTCS